VSLVGHKNYNLSIILPIARVDGGSCAIFEKCHFRRRGVTRAVELPAGSQPAQPTEAWCKAHNSDPSAVSNCIEAEKRLVLETAQKLPARPLPIPRPRPQAAPIVTAEPAQQAFDKECRNRAPTRLPPAGKIETCSIIAADSPGAC